MAINARCPKCSATYTVADRFAGLKGRCKKCQALFAMPVKSEVDIVLDEAAADAVSVETEPESSPVSDEPPPKRKKKKKRSAGKRGEGRAAWWWAGLAVVTGLCTLALLVMAAFGYRMTAYAWALYLILWVPLDTIIFALSVVIRNYFGSGFQLTEFRILLPKVLILVTVATFVSGVPFAGTFIALAVWFIGITSFFELEPMEAALLVAINFVLGLFAGLFLAGILISSTPVPSAAPAEKPPDATGTR